MRVLKKLFIRAKSIAMTTSGFSLRRFKLASRLLAGFMIVASISAAMGIYALINLSNMSAMSKAMYADILQPSQNVSEIQDKYQEMCIALRQLIVSNNQSMTKKHISEINTGLKTIPTVITATAKRLKQAESTKRLDDLTKAFGTYSEVMNTMVSLYENGQINEIVDQVSKTSELRNAERAMDAALDSLVYEVTSEASLINHDNTQTADTAFAITTAAVAAVLILSSLIGFVIYKGISKPIKKLTVNLKQLAEGETDIASVTTAAKDELGQMESSFRQILTAIKALEADTDMLIGAAMEGALSVRADELKHNGAYRKIVQGFNATLDAMMAPIDESTQVLHAFSQGRLNVAVEGEFKGDFARMKNALNSTLQTLSGYIGEISSVLQDMAGGMLSRSIDSEYLGDFAALKESINQCVVAFGSVINEITLASEGVAQGAYQLSADSQTVSQGAAEQAGELESFTDVMRRVADMAKRNADSAKRANELAQSAKTDAALGNEKMLLLQNEMKLINASSVQISKIIKVIDDIAFKTNILALNAAVEAARAGIHGRGFAVVAQEVRSLAIQSADAARETQVLIENERSKTADGTKMADETVSALTEMLEDIKKIVDFSGEIDASSQEQAMSMMQMDKGIEQLSKVVQNNLETAEHSAASSQELAAQAIYLKDMVGRFSLTGESRIVLDEGNVR